MGALPAEQYAKLRVPPPIPKMKNGDDGEAAFLKSIMEPACRVCKTCRRRGGFRPSANNLFLCQNCNHHKFYHGRRLHPMEPVEAVRKIQQIWRTYSANLMIRNLMKSIYEKHWHAEQGAYFYYNKQTDKSVWTKPILLGSHDLEPDTRKPPTPRPDLLADGEGVRPPLFTPSDYDTDSDLELGGEDHEDAEGAKHDGEPKPREEKKRNKAQLREWLRNEATAEERLEYAAELEVTKKRRRKRRERRELKAADAIQNVWRVFRAKQDMTEMLRSIYEKIWNEDHASFYWYNKASGESTWTRPVLLSKIGDVTPRFEYEDGVA